MKNVALWGAPVHYYPLRWASFLALPGSGAAVTLAGPCPSTPRLRAKRIKAQTDVRRLILTRVPGKRKTALSGPARGSIAALQICISFYETHTLFNPRLRIGRLWRSCNI